MFKQTTCAFFNPNKKNLYNEWRHRNAMIFEQWNIFFIVNFNRLKRQ